MYNSRSLGDIQKSNSFTNSRDLIVNESQRLPDPRNNKNFVSFSGDSNRTPIRLVKKKRKPVDLLSKDPLNLITELKFPKLKTSVEVRNSSATPHKRSLHIRMISAS